MDAADQQRSLSVCLARVRFYYRVVRTCLSHVTRYSTLFGSGTTVTFLEGNCLRRIWMIFVVV